MGRGGCILWWCGKAERRLAQSGRATIYPDRSISGHDRAWILSDSADRMIFRPFLFGAIAAVFALQATCATAQDIKPPLPSDVPPPVVTPQAAPPPAAAPAASTPAPSTAVPGSNGTA